MKGKFIRMYIAYLLRIVRMLFTSPLSCIHRSVRELCTTPDKRIKPQFILTSIPSMTNCHAVVTLWPYAMYQTDLTISAALWQLYQTNLLSCVAWRRLWQTNLLSCVARRPLSQTNLPSCGARGPLSQTNLPSCVAWRPLSQRNLPSCVARGPLCQTNLPSCAARRPLSQTNLPSCGARRPLALSQTNLPSSVARRPLSQTISKLLPSVEEQITPVLPREISYLTSHGSINVMGSVYTSVHALMNDTWRCTGFKKCNLSDVSANVLVSKRTENRGCPFVNSEQSHSQRKRTFQKKRDREPSRIPVHKVLKLLNKRKCKKRVKYLLIKSVPKSSFYEGIV